MPALIILSNNAQRVLAAATATPDRVHLPAGQLSRELYEEVNDVLTRLGGKWKSAGKAKNGAPQGAHVFPYDPRPLLAAVCETGLMPPKNPTAFFPTPPAVVQMMIEDARLDLAWPTRILEPSAGSGAIAEAIRALAPAATLDCVEVLPLNAQVLRDKGFTVHEQDFITYRPAEPYDLVLMNPPFSLEGDARAYITHINHAFELLRTGGTLVAIAPPGFLTNSSIKEQAFLQAVLEYGGYDRLPAKSFEASGTTVETVMIVLRKDETCWKDQPYCGYANYWLWQFFLYLDNDREWTAEQEASFQKIRAAGGITLGLFRELPEPYWPGVRALYEGIAKEGRRRKLDMIIKPEHWPHFYAAYLDEYQEWLGQHEAAEQE